MMPGRVSTRKLQPSLTLPAAFAALSGMAIGVGITLTVGF